MKLHSPSPTPCRSLRTNATSTRAAGLLMMLALLLPPRPAPAAITGHWSFEARDIFFSARIGFPMQARDLDTLLETQFGTTGEGDFVTVPNIGGQPVAIMRFPRTNPAGGYLVPHNAPPNGGGAAVNQYTIIMDVLYPAVSSGKKRALFQTDLNGNAEFLVNQFNRIGADGGVFSGNLTPDTWHRVAFAVDLAATPPAVAQFVDGVKLAEYDPGQGLDNRWAIRGLGFYFDTDDNGEVEPGYLSSLQFRDERLPDGVLTAMGGPSPDGIPTGPIPDPYLVSAQPPPESTRFPERSTVSPQPLIEAILIDGTNAVNLTELELALDGEEVEEPAITKTGVTNIVRFTVAQLLGPLSTHTVTLIYEDTSGKRHTNEWQFLVGPYAGLPAAAAAPAGSAHTRGFRLRTVQAPLGTQLAGGNRFTRALQQLNGTLTDTNGQLVPNVAAPGPDPNGFYEADVINYHLVPSAFGVFEADTPFPGIPSGEGGSELFATEVLAFLELDAGLHRMGISVTVDRTDNRTDDGFGLFTGVEPRNVLAPQVAAFHRNVTNAFISTFNINEFTLYAPTNGIYPFRLVYFQIYQDASLEWWSVTDENERVLINDPADPNAIQAYRYSTAPGANRPYLAEINPRAEVAGVSPLLPIEALILDDQAGVDAASVQLTLNGRVAPATVTHTNGRTTVFYQPNATRTEESNHLQLVYQDDASPDPRWFTNDWNFTILVNPNVATRVAGQWDFDFCDLSATVGQDLEFFGGPNGLTAAATQFGTTAQFGIDDINGVPATVMFVPGDPNNQIGYLMHHGIPANGGGTRVNQFTLIFEVYWLPPPPDKYFASFINFDPANTSDGDFFFDEPHGWFGQGGSGYEGDTFFDTLKWHRVSFAVDMAANPPVVTKYLDGVKHADQLVPNNELDGARRTLPLDGAVLFADGDDGERMACYVNSIQVRAGKLTDAELEALGGPSAAGIPLDIGAPPPPIEARIQYRPSGTQLQLAWPAAFADYELESATTLNPADWQSVGRVAAPCITVPLSNGIRFYRLHRPTP